jgi:hypothetical protein
MAPEAHTLQGDILKMKQEEKDIFLRILSGLIKATTKKEKTTRKRREKKPCVLAVLLLRWKLFADLLKDSHIIAPEYLSHFGN